MIKITDHESISAIRDKNGVLTTKVYNWYKKDFIYVFKQRLNKNEEEIFDIYQEAFLELCNKIYTNKVSETSLTSSLKTYLYGIGKMIVMATNRKNQRVASLLTDVPDIEDDEPGLGIENEKIIQVAVNQMGEPCHTLLTLQYWEEKSGEEIATALNYKNVSTAKTQKYKCIQKLKKDLKDKIIYLN
ncbi:MAG: sigma-70 family RNA polymerase sigma factor [Mariniphaga sp.]